MYDQRTIDGIRITRPKDKHGRYEIENTRTGAYFSINKSINIDGKPLVFYLDSFDSLMSNNNKLKVTINKDQVIQFKEYQSQILLSNNLSITILPMKDIQEIADKTFYLDGQKHAFDFIKFFMQDDDSCELLFRYN